jgi:hypothetical protein
LIALCTTARSSAAWQVTQVRAPGSACRRGSGISSPHSTHQISPSPAGIRARAVLNGICRETGYAPDVDFLKHLRKQREEG